MHSQPVGLNNGAFLEPNAELHGKFNLKKDEVLKLVKPAYGTCNSPRE